MSSPGESAAARMVVHEESDVASLNSSLDARLIDLRDQLLQRTLGPNEYNGGIATATTTLLEIATNTILERLVPLLLLCPPTQQSDQQNSLMSSDDALQVLGYLCQSVPPDQFLKPAAVAIRAKAEQQLGTNHDSSSVPSGVLHVTPALAQVLVQQLSLGTDVQVAEEATRTVVAFCRYQWQWAGEIFLPALVEVWRTTTTTTTTTRDVNRAQRSTTSVRCATAVMEITVLDDRTMQAAIASGAMQLWMSTLVEQEEDPLLQISLLDLLEQLATQPHCHCHFHRAQWLLSDAVVEPILRWAGGWEDGTEPDPFLGGPALRVVAALCSVGLQQQSQDEDINENNNSRSSSGVDNIATSGRTQNIIPKFHRALHNMIAQQQSSASSATSSELDRLAIVDALSSLAGSSSSGLTLILEDFITLRAWLSLQVAQPKLKAAILVSVARVLDPVPQYDAAGDRLETGGSRQKPSDTLGMELYSSLGKVNVNSSPSDGTAASTELLLAMAKSPLPEVRLAVYTLLQAVSKLPMGGQALFLHGDFFTFLLDRERETTKEGREAKWSIVKSLIDHSPVKGLLADDVVRQLETYVQQGPYYVKTLSWEVADQ